MAQRDQFAIRDKFVGHAAGLGALASIGRTAAQSFAGETLPRVSHAKSSMHKHLDRHGGCIWSRTADDRLNFFQRALPGQNHQVAAKCPRKLNSFGAGNGHLRRDVNRKIGRELSNQAANSNVLNNGRVDAVGNNRPGVLLSLNEFIFKNQGVERHITFHTAPVQKFHQLWQIGFRKVLCAHPRVELFQAKIDRISSILDRGPGAFPITGRGKQFGETHLFWRVSRPGARRPDD
jgi:hypothetical protein